MLSCNAGVKHNMNHFIVSVIIYESLCFLQHTVLKCYGWGCTTSNKDRAGVLFGFTMDAERYVRDLM